MKKVIFLSAFAVTGLLANAQTMFGLQAGANFATIKSEPGFASSSATTKANTGFTVGALADVDFGNSISFRPELNFIQKGGEEEFTTPFGQLTNKGSQEIKLSYIQLSPNFVYNLSAGTGKFFIGIGPEFSLGVGGKIETKSEISGPGFPTTTSETNEDVKFDGESNNSSTDNKYHLKSFDYGVNFLAGYKMAGGFFVSSGYTLGLGNISPDANTSIKNSGFNVKLGYMFGGAGKSKTTSN